MERSVKRHATDDKTWSEADGKGGDLVLTLPGHWSRSRHGVSSFGHFDCGCAAADEDMFQWPDSPNPT